MQFPATTLSFQKNKWYVVVTIPEELRDGFGGRKQLKLSTGTSDKRLAEQRKHEKSTELYQRLDEAGRTKNPVYIAMKNYIDAIGNVGIMNLEDKDLTEPRVIEDVLFALHRSAQEAMYSGDDRAKQLAQLRIEPAYAEVERLRQAREREIANATEKKFSEASAEFLATNSWGREKTKTAAQRAWADFQDQVGDLALSKITKTTGYDYVEELEPKFANKTIRNRVGFVSQVLSYAERKGWLDQNPFAGLDLKGRGRKPQRYKSFTDAQLHQLFSLNMPADVHLLLSVLVATGMRLDEAATLETGDLKKEGDIHYFDLTGSDKVLKNMGAARKVPIINKVAKRIPKKSGRMFPRFKLDGDGKAQAAASKACMPYIRKVTKDEQVVVHSLRGTLKDMLRDANVPKEINDFITGHDQGDVAGDYGAGPSLKARYEALCKVDHPWLKEQSAV